VGGGRGGVDAGSGSDVAVLYDFPLVVLVFLFFIFFSILPAVVVSRMPPALGSGSQFSSV